MPEELHTKYRPQSLAEVIGQEQAVKQLQGYIDAKAVPHAICLIGPSGVGKTTLARIMRVKVRCLDSDLVEINAAKHTGVDSLKDATKSFGLATWASSPEGKKYSRCWIIDEAHNLSKPAQSLLLPLLEEPNDWNYFFLATTDPGKLLRTILTRCAEVKVKPLTQATLTNHVKLIAGKEKIKLSSEEAQLIAEAADGSARKALVILGQIGRLNSEDRMEAILSTDYRAKAIDLAKELIVSFKPSWDKVSAILKTLEDDPEGVRRLILAFASSVLLNGGKMSNRAAFVIRNFASNYFDTGRAGLVLDCHRVVYEGRK